jgi:hypothetical protein
MPKILLTKNTAIHSLIPDSEDPKYSTVSGYQLYLYWVHFCPEPTDKGVKFAGTLPFSGKIILVQK